MPPLEVPLWILYAIPTPLTIVLFVKLALPRRPAFATVAASVSEGFTTTHGRKLVVLIAALLTLNSVQAWFDPAITEALGLDFTAWVRSVEGDFVERLQSPLLDSWALAAVLTWAYVCAYVAVLFAPPLVWAPLRNYDAIREHALGFAGNYLLALPFYFFFPVVEVGWSNVSDAVPLMESVFAGISDQMRYESALDNCFPSLHVACATTAAVVCHRHGPRGLRAVGWAVAVVTVYDVMALGVHWGLDVVSGIPFGLMNAALGRAVAQGMGRRTR